MVELSYLFAGSEDIVECVLIAFHVDIFLLTQVRSGVSIGRLIGMPFLPAV